MLCKTKDSIHYNKDHGQLSSCGGWPESKLCSNSQFSVCWKPIPNRLVGRVDDLRTGGTWFEFLVQPIFFLRIDDSHCNRIYFSLTHVYCFTDGYVGKQPVAWKEYCTEYWLKELQEGMNMCSGHCSITEITLKVAIKTIQSINQMHVEGPADLMIHSVCGHWMQYY